jgi:hypothetical protein
MRIPADAALNRKPVIPQNYSACCIRRQIKPPHEMNGIFKSAPDIVDAGLCRIDLLRASEQPGFE